jgi:hypothetical protein
VELHRAGFDGQTIRNRRYGIGVCPEEEDLALPFRQPE